MFDLIPFGRKEKDLYRYFNDFEKSFFGDSGSYLSAFKTDIIDKDGAYVLQAELPGFAKEDIHIDLNGDYLTISAEHKEETEYKSGQYIRKERRFGSFARSFNVSDVDTDKITASYKDGVLELSMPKQTEEKAKVSQIEIQ